MVALLASGVASVVVAPRSVQAQPAAALGVPLPDASLPVGTVSVRLVAGSPANPVVGADVTLIVNGQPRIARTNAEGRAMFAGLPANANAQAKAVGEDKGELTSASFSVPSTGGIRLMLSTKPFQGGAAMTGAGAGAASGMPDARQMSGQPQPSRGDDPGTFTVRVTYDNLSMGPGGATDSAPPVGVPVMLVAYASDGSIKVQSRPTDATGLARFTDLDMTGATSYFALAVVQRGAGTDRLISVPRTLSSREGLRVILSAAKRDATTAAIDDYDQLIPIDKAVLPAGKVRVTLDGVAPEGSQVTLHDATTGNVIGTVPAQKSTRPDPSLVRGNANFTARPDLPVGIVEVEVRGGAGSASAPLAAIPVTLIDAATEKPVAGAEGVTGADGKVRLTGPGGTQLKAVLDINGRRMSSSTMELTKGGGRLDVTAQWPAQGRPEAVFDVAHAPGQVLYAVVKVANTSFVSLPLATAPDRGLHGNIYVYPRTVFTFEAIAYAEDEQLGVQGTFEITNYAWAPYVAGPDGLVIPLPRGHKGAVVAKQDADVVTAAKGQGFRILGAIPPGGRKFRGGFSMPIEHGDVEMAFTLPYGTWQSSLQIRQLPGMSVLLPESVQGETRTAPNGDPWFVIPELSLQPATPLSITIRGLPSVPSWRVWMPRIVGVLVLLLLVGGIGIALRVSSRGRATDIRRKQQILDEIVALDAGGSMSPDQRARRERLVDELERLWG